MKKHFMILALGLAIAAPAFGLDDIGKNGGIPTTDTGVGGKASLPNSDQGLGKARSTFELAYEVGKRADKEYELEQKKSAHLDGHEPPDVSEHADGHERQATDRGDERPEKPASTNDRRGTDAQEAHDAHEVHEVNVHEPEVHEHEAPAHDPVVHEGNAGRRN